MTTPYATSACGTTSIDNLASAKYLGFPATPAGAAANHDVGGRLAPAAPSSGAVPASASATETDAALAEAAIAGDWDAAAALVAAPVPCSTADATRQLDLALLKGAATHERARRARSVAAAGLSAHDPGGKSGGLQGMMASFAKVLDASNGQVEQYQDAVKKVSAFYKELTDLQVANSKRVGTDKKHENKNTVATKEIVDEIEKLKSNWASPGQGLLHSFSTKGEADAFAARFNGIAITEGQANGPGYDVSLDVKSILQPMRDAVTRGDRPRDEDNWNSYEMRTITMGDENVTQRMQASIKMLTDRYARAVETFDRLVKMLSSTITAFHELNRNILQG